MAIEFTCACGHRFELADSQAGDRIVCPQCKQPFIIPSDDPDEDDEFKLADPEV